MRVITIRKSVPYAKGNTLLFLDRYQSVGKEIIAIGFEAHNGVHTYDCMGKIQLLKVKAGSTCSCRLILRD